ncbi:hypothetical protein PMAYCL1PPCAC_08689, partial [Pristionchus mayeri]
VDYEIQFRFAAEFSINQILGVGGFGIVFEATNTLDKWSYAVKRISVQAVLREETKALEEVQALAKLDHPNIVRYNSTWIEKPPLQWQSVRYEGSFIYIQMQVHDLKLYHISDKYFFQLCNYSLSRWLEENTTPNSRALSRMKSWFKQIVSAVAYIHKNNLIHRDLKPSNILFSDRDHLKLCDLGIATERRSENGEETTLARSNIGTPLYMSPEQRSNSKYGSKTDVFALGLILAELCVVMTTSQ